MVILSSPQIAALKHKTTLHIVILLILPILLCLINDNWIFNPIPGLNPTQNALDAWMYHSAFQHYPDLTPLMQDRNIGAPNLYYLERVGWILIGYVIYHVFPPLVANFVLHLANYYLGIFSLYFLVRLLLSAETALITALMMGLYPWYLLSVGYDYLDGYNNSLFLLALLCIALAFVKRRSILIVIAGAAYAIMVANNATIGVNIAVIGGIALWLWWQQTPRKISHLFRSALLFSVGSLLMLVALGVLYYLVTHEWNYWRFTTYFSEVYSKGLFGDPELRGARIRSLIYQINPFSLHVFPLFTALIAALRLAQLKTLSPGNRDYLKIIALLFAGTYIIWTVLDSILLPYLTIYLYASYLMPTTFLLFAGVVHGYTERFGLAPRYAIGFTLVGCLPALLAAFTPLLNGWNYDSNVNFVLALLVILGLILFFVRRYPVFILLIGLGFMTLHVLSFPFSAVYVSRGIGRANFSRIQGLMDSISDRYPTEQLLSQTWGWYDTDEIVGHPGVTPISTYPNIGLGFWWGRLFNMKSFFPTHAVNMAVIIEPGQNIESVQKRIEKFDYTLTIQSVDDRVPDYPVYFTNLTPIPIQNFDRRYRWYSKDIPWYAVSSASGEVVVETGPSALTTVELDLPHSDHDVLAEVCILSSYAPDFPGKIQLLFNDQPLATELLINSQDCPYLFRATISTDAFNQTASKQFGVKTDIIRVGDSFFSRSLGVVISWIQFSQK